MVMGSYYQKLALFTQTEFHPHGTLCCLRQFAEQSQQSDWKPHMSTSRNSRHREQGFSNYGLWPHLGSQSTILGLQNKLIWKIRF